MSKLPLDNDRSKLPRGWAWADWHRAGDAEQFWHDTDDQVFSAMWHRMMELLVANRRLSDQKVRHGEGVSKGKIAKPNPGWEFWFFRDGNVRYITQIVKAKHTSRDFKKQESVAIEAKDEHLAKKTSKRVKKP